VTPADDDDALAQADRFVDDAGSMMSSHLLCHADNEGYYVPLALDAPVFIDVDDPLAGAGMIGSSQGLLDELRRVAPAIGIALEADGSLSDAEAARIFAVRDGAPFWREQIVWLSLHEACVASIASGAAIVFH
jgi:hypothetical protein